ncbi:MAG: GNAT family N-acetyltransferase [Candidatus Micrarchaeota archaeon]|nr:GNAT family N-acetyltransferase [Candidatus Micrarchaeota archaeon]
MPGILMMISILFPSARTKILPEDCFLVAEKGGVLIGFCHYRIRGNRCYIAGLGVLPQYREHGVGSQLLAQTLYNVEKAGIQTTYLKVRSTNQAAKLYTKFGFFEKKWGDVLTLVRKKPS